MCSRQRSKPVTVGAIFPTNYSSSSRARGGEKEQQHHDQSDFRAAKENLSQAEQ